MPTKKNKPVEVESKDNAEPKVTKNNIVDESTNVEETEAGLFNAESKSSSDILRKQRKSKNITVETVADELNLSASVIRAIESDNWESLPEATYVRGYVRSYASFLGLDVEEVLMNFRYKNTESDLSLDAMPLGMTNHRAPRSVPKSLKWLVILGAIGFGAYSLFSKQITQFSNEYLQKSTVLATAEETVKNVSTKIEEVTSSNNSVDSTEVKSEIETKTASETEGKTVPDNLKEMISLTFTGISWVDISDESGRKVVYKSFPPGETMKIKAAKPLKVFIGNVAAVQMSYEGKEIPLTEYQEEDHAKFTLD